MAPSPHPSRASSARARARARPPSGSPRAASRDRAQPRRQRRQRRELRRWQWQREQLRRQRGAGGVWVWREGSARPERVSVLFPLPTPGNLAGHPVQAGPCPELRTASSCLAILSPVPSDPAPNGPGCGAHRGGCTPPAAAVADGGVRPAKQPVPSTARPVCGSAEPRRRVLRGRGRPLGGCRALGGGRPGAASSSFAAAAASSQCSVSREPRLVDAEPFSSTAASSQRCSRTSAWRPKPYEPSADALRTEPLFSAFPAVPRCPPSTLLQPPFPFPLGKWFPLPREMCTSHD